MKTITSIKVITPELIQRVEKIVLDNYRLKKKQLVEIVEVSDTTIFKILHDRQRKMGAENTHASAKTTRV